MITIPLLAVGALLTGLDFNILWRYFSWSNQTLAMISLWVAASYMIRTNKNKVTSLIAAIPASFMSAVSMTYILMAPEGLRLSSSVSYPIGIAFACALFTIYVFMTRKASGKNPDSL